MKAPQNARRLWGDGQTLVKGFLLKPLALVVLATAALGAAPILAQTRYTPEDSAVILSSGGTGQKDAAELREALQRWRADPKNLTLSTETAQQAMLAAIQQGDLRWLGNAKAMLAPWWTAQDLPSRTLFVRALIRQGTHDFKGALADLDAAIAKDPGQPEHWAWRFAIYLVIADMTKAKDECTAIGQRFGLSEQASCNAVLLYRTGNPKKAIVALEALSRHPEYQGRLAQEWLAFHWGEAHRVAGDRAKARKIWEAQLNKGSGGHAVRVALIDLLNSEKQFADAWKVNATKPRSDALLVAAILSSVHLNNGKAEELKLEFNQRLSYQRARGESPNERPTIKFTLYVEGKAHEALAMARQAWKTEREPADALLYARAAIESGAPDQALELLQWQSVTGYTEPELDQLLVTIRRAAADKRKQ